MQDLKCVFCRLVTGMDYIKFVDEGRFHVAFEPLRPHAPGHVLFVPKEHVRDATDKPTHAMLAFQRAAIYVRDRGLQANIITSVGPDATQTVFHAHVHVIPRGEGDGLRASWPWRVREGEELGPGEVAPPDVI